MAYEHERKTAIEAVINACRLCGAVQHRLADHHRMAKNDASPVTVADFGAQALIISHILRTFPHDALVGEEEASVLRQPEQQRLKDEVIRLVNEVDPSMDEAQILAAIDCGAQPCDFTQRYWTLDPVDGTKGFLRGEQYAVALALVEQGEPVLGVLGCPNILIDPAAPERGKGVVFIGVKGQGAFIRPLDGAQERPIHAGTDADPSRARVTDSVEKEHAAHDAHAKIAAALGIAAPSLRLDSQAKYGIVARGEADIYLRIISNPRYFSCIWDHAPGVAVVKAAGGEVTDARGKPLDFSVGRRLTRNSGVIVTNGAIHEAVVQAARQVGAHELSDTF